MWNGGEGQYQETFGVTQNEGSRHGSGGGTGPETYGATYNEAGRSRGHGQHGAGSDNYRTGQGWSQQPNGSVNSYGTTGNEPSSHRNSDNHGPQTYGVTDNQPSRHRQVEILVKNLSGKSLVMHVDLDWAQSKLLQEITRDQGMNSGQLRVSYGGQPLSGTRTLREAGLCRGCTVDINSRLRGG